MTESPSLFDQDGADAEPTGDPGDPASAGRSRERSRFRGCLPILAVLAGLALLAAVFVPKGIDKIRDQFDGPEDFPGPGSGEVLMTIEPGQSVRSMGEELEDLGVVASADAFVDAASDNPAATGIQAGIYTLKKKMQAADVVDILADPKNISRTTVTIPEGLRAEAVIKVLAKGTDFGVKQFEKALARPQAIGLPSYAKGDPEGYLFPATYEITPKDTPKTILAAMVAKGERTTADLDLEAKAADIGLTPHEVITVASMLEFEARLTEDYPKVARTIYNRLDADMALQSDATVAYANGLSGEVWTTADQRSVDSPYNTYLHKGLPPGPIGNPGQRTIEAALNPADGDWLYWVVINLKTGKTVFSETLAEHNAATEKLREYCRSSDAC